MGAPPGRAAWWSQPPTGPPHPAQGRRSASICQGHRLLRDTSRRSWARCREGQGVRGDKQRAAVAGDPGDGRYPSAAAQAVFVRLVPPAAVGVALMEAESRVTQRAALPGEAGPRLPADRPPATGRAAGHGEDHRSGAGPPVRGRSAMPVRPRLSSHSPRVQQEPTLRHRPPGAGPRPSSGPSSQRTPWRAHGSQREGPWRSDAGPRLNSNWATPLEATLSRTRPGGASGTCALGPSGSAGSPGPRPAPAQETLRRHPLCPAQRLHPLPAWVVSHMLVPLPNRPVPVPLFCL